MTSEIRHDWTLQEVQALFELPFADLMFRAQSIHRKYFDPNAVQISTLLSIKTGTCPEDCAYCPQSGHYKTGVQKQKLMSVEEVVSSAKIAKEKGASRFCMGAGWRNPTDHDLEQTIEMVKQIKSLGMETCLTLGMLTQEQANKLKEAGLDYYNHNVDTSPEYYEKIITTRTYQDRLDTLEAVRQSGMNVCCGGIVGMGEDLNDRCGLLMTLANLPEHPDSVPINKLIPIEGTPLAQQSEIDPIDFARTIAVARIMMPKSFVRLSAGRNTMSDELQAMCFFAGANSIHYGEKLLVTPLPEEEKDQALFQRLGVKPLVSEATQCA
ncbi:MAG: biotin synthase BioB [Proteobacteria bacterium]|nr:biotin synthase BioB [Pseudomonadota bacterium]